jgi:hypothetical protein
MGRTAIHWKRLVLGTTCLVLSLLLVGTVAADKKTYLERYTAEGMSLSGGTNSTIEVEIAIERWSSDEERAKLMSAAEKSSETLTQTLESMPEIGFVNFGMHRHSVRYARQTQEGDTRKVVVASYRILTAPEVTGKNLGDSENYTVSLAELELNAKGHGTGTLAPATQVKYDAANNKLDVDTLNVQPMRLSGVRTHTPKDK